MERTYQLGVGDEEVAERISVDDIVVNADASNLSKCKRFSPFLCGVVLVCVVLLVGNNSLGHSSSSPQLIENSSPLVGPTLNGLNSPVALGGLGVGPTLPLSGGTVGPINNLKSTDTTKSPSFPPTPAPVTPTTPPTFAPTVSESDGLKFTTYRRGYPILNYFSKTPSEFLKYKILQGHSGVVEPFADMYFQVLDDDSVARQLKFSVCPSDDSGCFDVMNGDSFNIDCTPRKDTFAVSLTENRGGDWAEVGNGFLKCMYVRRELRSLTQEDLDKTVSAMYKMWELEEDEGQALYGENFHNYARLLEYHYFNAAWQDADHVHEGNGFLPQHMKMDLIFSRSLTAIDPSVSLMYWDFTIENATGVQVWDSPMFTEQTFGSLRLPVDKQKGWTYANDVIENGAIPDGRWKNFRADLNEKYDELHFGYGYMRAPWNFNPANVITRFTSVDKYLPSCQAHHKLVSYSSFATFLHQVPYGSHAATHGVIGGVFGCDLFDDMLNAGYIISEEAKQNLCKNWIFYLKELYRAAILVPKSDCESADETGAYSTAREHQKCGFTCIPDMLNILALQLRTSVLNSDYEVIDTETMPEEGYVAWKNFICEGEGYKIFGGDHLESASPADPSFWPIHPTLERILHAKYMANGFDTDVFPSDPLNEYVCNKQTCYDPDHDTTDDGHSGFGAWTTCCYGHYGGDQLMDAPNADRTRGVGPTNYEILAWNNPTKDSYAMDYIYDSFTWDHCSDAGFDISRLLMDQYKGVNEYVEEQFSSEKGW